ncbi:hypothetical protein [Bradyrhizobium sp. UFLA05-112]
MWDLRTRKVRGRPSRDGGPADFAGASVGLRDGVASAGIRPFSGAASRHTAAMATMSDEFNGSRAKILQDLAEQSDAFIKMRLLGLMKRYA